MIVSTAPPSLAPGLLYLVAGVLAQASAIDLDAGRVLQRTVSVPAGKLAEVCRKLTSSSRVQWEFAAAAPLFNIHYPESESVHMPARNDQVSHARGELAVAVTQDYCWMWTNKTTRDIEVNLMLRRSQSRDNPATASPS
jgi:hypothetical protein